MWVSQVLQEGPRAWRALGHLREVWRRKLPALGCPVTHMHPGSMGKGKSRAEVQGGRQQAESTSTTYALVGQMLVCLESTWVDKSKCKQLLQELLAGALTEEMEIGLTDGNTEPEAGLGCLK
eukprot:11329503-Prorocentrum_lima.AAC.1